MKVKTRFVVVRKAGAATESVLDDGTVLRTVYIPAAGMKPMFTSEGHLLGFTYRLSPR